MDNIYSLYRVNTKLWQLRCHVSTFFDDAYECDAWPLRWDCNTPCGYNISIKSGIAQKFKSLQCTNDIIDELLELSYNDSGVWSALVHSDSLAALDYSSPPLVQVALSGLIRPRVSPCPGTAVLCQPVCDAVDSSV
eukprot:scaffold166222_cov16-Prasinocladus_malaysianus.AAC.1